jgi:hypothetical protein
MTDSFLLPASRFQLKTFVIAVPRLSSEST